MRLMFVLMLSFIAGSAAAQQPDPRQGETTCVENARGAKTSPQPVESQIILPAVGGETKSAATTVQRDGRSAEPAPDCPPDAATAAKKPVTSDPRRPAVDAQSK
jgi:hypothetical protein